MNAEILAEWFRRQDLQVVRTASSYWHMQGPRAYQAFPYHWLIEPEEDEIATLLRSRRALGLRYSTQLHAPTGALSYHVTYSGPDYSLEQLSKKARYDVRRALKTASVERVSLRRLAQDGWQLRLETLKRQGRTSAEDARGWRSLCEAAEQLDGFEAWAAIIQGKMAASLIAFTLDDCCSILYQQSRTDYLPSRVNTALTYAFTQEIMRRPGRHWMFYGLHSLDAPPSVDEFKFRMGYVAKALRQRVVFHPWLRPFVGPSVDGLLTWCRRHLPDHATLAKAEGFVRFHRNGSLPLDRQPVPGALRRDAIGVEART